MNQYNIENKTLPLIPLRGISMFPHMVVHFDIGREKSINALEKAMMDDSEILLCTQKDPKVNDPSVDDFYHIGTVAKVKQMLKLPGGSIRVLVEGVNRGRVVNINKEEPFFMAEVEELTYEEENIEKDSTIEAAMRLVTNDFEEYLSYNDRISSEILITITDIEDPGRLADVISSYIYLKQEDDQKILESFDFYERLELLHVMLQEEIEVLKIEDQINQRVKKQINKVQKEYYLKEQIKAIQKELGQDDDIMVEVEEYEEKINEIKMPKEVKEKAMKEVERLLKLSPHSQETGVIRTYLDWIIDLPWNKETKDKIDIKKSRDILNGEHYGLSDVKERILEFIAIRKLTNSMKGPIICLVGPPGVGKTSIARSIAKSLNKKFVRMSLGGVRDEAEIRGHRRTYIGSMPGSIINSMKKAGTKNPVFLFDEIDKLSSDYRGDPASALLEVLDPEQNVTFTDHYLDVPFDLSKVLFLTTANTTATIPAPLLDRMEVIRISGYTEEEKLQIALNHLLPKQIKEHGLSEKKLIVSESAIRSIINNYTREAGVRNLERNIANLCRKAAKRIVEENKEVIRINNGNLSNYLGAEKYRFDTLEEENQIGVANGLAWTAVGGETLSVEVNSMKGTGKIQLTGKLGDVMKESAMAAISYIRANSNTLGIEENFHKEMDIHIHVPEGAIPKDGPSAGITIATAVISALSNRPIKREVAMTGEITLRGRVLPVGGIKEKILAANRMGIKKVLLPLENEKDLEEIPDKIRRKMKFVLVKNMEQVIEQALTERVDKNENN
ncbi:endopeptidase La [Tissierella sp. MB52-C2]|uniref:endopeptidase La n=1 Tax=Tissierella sp. MB52-C2 TaxID=3070999 RepID=UPI00280B12AB|nr:endopeptidase La [Tissierella sp. MB52-C2]WMM25705.1 endopeptidase La [Tissierella sp. MB52-C2]